MTPEITADVLVAGGGLSGIVTALELLRAGKSVVLVDRDTPERLGGLALWAFGGMALVDTPLQRSRGIADTPERALSDWIRFGELDKAAETAGTEVWPLQWARYYVEHSRSEVYDWLQGEGIRFLRAVNWVERGLQGEGNSLPRYHVIWGTARELVRCLVAALHRADIDARRRIGIGQGQGQPRLILLHQHRVLSLENTVGQLSGAIARNETTGEEVRLSAPVVVLAMGGINGSHEECRANWPGNRPMPERMLNGAHPFSDGKLHHWVADHQGGCLTHLGEMWNYAAGIPHPYPHFPGHGLSIIPCKSALWLNHRGVRIGPEPLVTGFDTHELCQRIAAQEKPWTWQLLNERIAFREFAISGAEHNPAIRDKNILRFLSNLMWGHRDLVRQMQEESAHFIVDDSLAGLTKKMNALTCSLDVEPSVLQATVDRFDANFSRSAWGASFHLHNDDQIRRILHARQWFPDRLRTCKPAPLQGKGSGPYIAIHTQLITRKSLGGLRTDLYSRVLDAQDRPIDGLYCVGEAAGFGGGGAHGKRSLEGTFLPGCILTARAAARAIVSGRSVAQ